MDGVYTSLVWAAAVVLIAVIFVAYFGKSVRDLLDANHQRVEAKRDQIRVSTETESLKALEKKAALEVDEHTLEERIALRRAELRKQAVRTEADAEITKATIDAQTAAEQQVIAARAERRVQAAREEPLTVERDPRTLFFLMEAYKLFIARLFDDEPCFDDWLEDASLLDIQPAMLESLLNGYKAYIATVDEDDMPTFKGWLGNLAVVDGRLVNSSY